jgi:hypothetical protein
LTVLCAADLHVEGVHQRVDTLDTRDEFEAPADVECGARRCRHEHAVDASGLAVQDVVGMHGQHRRCSTVGVDQLGGQARLDPLRAQDRGGRQAGGHTAAAGS